MVLGRRDSAVRDWRDLVGEDSLRVFLPSRFLVIVID